MAFDIHFRRSAGSHLDRVVLVRGLSTLQAAEAARKVGGDLVVYGGSDVVVQDSGWLWESERGDPDCFARRAMVADAGRVGVLCGGGG